MVDEKKKEVTIVIDPEKNDLSSFIATKEDIKDLVPAEKPQEPPVVLAPKTNDDLATDFDYVRNNLYLITQKSVDALNTLSQIAKDSQHPRAYEVFSLLVKTIADAQKDLLNIHQQREQIQGEPLAPGPDVVNNNLFIGTTAQLDEIIKNMIKKK